MQYGNAFKTREFIQYSSCTGKTMYCHDPPTSTTHAIEYVAKHLKLNLPVIFKDFSSIKSDLSYILRAR